MLPIYPTRESEGVLMFLVILIPMLYMGKLFLVNQLHKPYCVFLMGMPREIKTDNGPVHVSNVFGLFGKMEYYS